MEINRCFGCMAQITAYPCASCGYDPRREKPLDYALRPGTILNGKYLVGKVLGQGGFGITYVGWDLSLERKVAIKEYFPSGQVSRHPSTGSTLQWYSTEQAQAARTGGREMFLKEARKMTRVDDVPQVVAVQDLFQENLTAYIVMNFVEGETLKERLRKTGPLPWEQAKKIFLPVMEAMEQVHGAGLIHRDLSPDNLMLQPNGKVKILDLGAAKDLNMNNGASSMQVAKGGFSPLEQYTQRGGSGTWTDVYALAATMYYTLTGVLPPSAVDRLDNDTLRWDLPQLTSLPGNVIRALQKAMAVSPQKRTQTMAQFRGELDKKEVPDRPFRFLKPILAAAVLIAVILIAAVCVGVFDRSTFAETAVGDVVTFGTYEQDGNPDNGEETIAWLVLDVKDGKALLLSRYALDARPYQDDTSSVTWENSSLRSWMNEEFLNTAFSAQEKRCIQSVTVEGGGGPGRSTTDRVFLLSAGQIEQYAPAPQQRRCEPTDYAVNEGADTRNQYCWWWLLTEDMHLAFAECVYPNGGCDTRLAAKGECAVRPAIWVRLDRISG